MIQMTTISFTCEWKVMTHHAVKLDEPSQLLLIIYTPASIIFDPWGGSKKNYTDALLHIRTRLTVNYDTMTAVFGETWTIICGGIF